MTKRFMPSVVVALTLTAMPALAAVPLTMSYQGVLTDNSGNVITSTPHNFTFRVYDDPTSILPVNLLWTEQHNSVPVTLGGFSVVLGNGTPAVPLTMPFDKQYYLGIAVDGGLELSPRTPLNASPYSVISQSLEDGTASALPIRMKTLAGVTSPSDGGVVFIPMPVPANKLLSVSVLVQYTATGSLPPNYTYDPCFEYEWYVFGGNLYVRNMPGNSSCLGSLPFTVLIAHTQ